MTIGWNFPKNNFGETIGISEAGVETFKGSPFDSLAREICQNSLDARLVVNKPVIVEFQEKIISSQQLHDLDKLRDAFDRSIDFWGKVNENKTIEFCKNAIKIIDKDEIPILRISDFNTTGLVGSNEEYGTPWHNLVKSSGVSQKGGSSGGSYGIGKSAPFACTDLRTIYYSTLDINGLRASQGVTRLVTFRDIDGDLTTGRGYYGIKKDNSPIMKPLFLDNYFTRIESGTDIYLIGFQNQKSWKDDIIEAVLEGFLISIYEENLEVIVSGEEISKNTLPFLMEKYKDNLKKTYNYYQVLISESSQEFIYNIEGLGKLSLSVLLDPNLHRQVLVTRINGMKLFDRGYISSTIYFAGILRLIDDSVNEFFRLLEPPEHNAWEPERHSNKKIAKERVQEIYRYMKSQILEIGKIPVSEEIDAEGVGEYLPDDISLFNAYSSQDKDEYISDNISNIEIIAKERTINSKDFERDSDKNIKEEIDVFGEVDDEGDIDGGNSSGNPNVSDGGSGSGGKYSENFEGKNELRKVVQVKAIKLRLFVIDSLKNMYKLIFTPKKSFKEGYIIFKIAGEESNLKARIKDARIVGNLGKRLICREDKIYFNNIEEGSNINLTFILDYSEACSLEVGIYEYTE